MANRSNAVIMSDALMEKPHPVTLYTFSLNNTLTDCFFLLTIRYKYVLQTGYALPY